VIIGLTGRNGSGKGEVVNFLTQAGFVPYSLSDILREELKRRKKRITRANLIAIGKELREKNGLSVLAEKTIPKIELDKNFVIDSIRNPAEVKALQKLQDFTMVEITATEKIRFDRIKKRKRESDPKTLVEFRKVERAETHSKAAASQQLITTAKLADLKIPNNGSLDLLHDNIRKTVQKISKTMKRPPWDRYFMNIALQVALRSNCLKRKVAAVIVKDKRIISTGYNGTPRGIQNCNEGGCPRCNSLTSSGTNLGECFCSHAEENAITQSAYHGVNIKGTTLYSTLSPCIMCTKMIINSGIEEVVYNAHYPLGKVPLTLLKSAGIKTRSL
jgi:dCMP deaminase